MKIAIYSILDILIGIYLGRILSINFFADKKQIKNIDLNENSLIEVKENDYLDKVDSNYLVEIIYIFNPLSIISCVSMQLRIFYNFFFFFLISNFDIDFEVKKNTGFFRILLTSLLSVLTILICPAYFFIVTFYYLRNFYFGEKIQKIKMLIIWLLAILLSGLMIYILFGVNEFYGILNQYSNYFFIRDTLPNFGLMWILFAEVIFIIFV